MSESYTTHPKTKVRSLNTCLWHISSWNSIHVCHYVVILNTEATGVSSWSLRVSESHTQILWCWLEFSIQWQGLFLKKRSAHWSDWFHWPALWLSSRKPQSWLHSSNKPNQATHPATIPANGHWLETHSFNDSFKSLEIYHLKSNQRFS